MLTAHYDSEIRKLINAVRGALLEGFAAETATQKHKCSVAAMVPVAMAQSRR
jgi:hypothetical protein